MIPTIVIVNDDNKHLVELQSILELVVRVKNRDSFQGEQLYKTFEGVLFFDKDGKNQFIRKDNYQDVVKTTLHQLSQLDTNTFNLLKNYLNNRTTAIYRPSNLLNQLDDLTREQIEDFMSKIYDSEE